MEAAFPGVAVGNLHGCLDEVGIGCEGLTVECGHTTEELIRPRTLNPQMLNKWLMVLWSASLRTLSEEGVASLALLKDPVLAFPVTFYLSHAHKVLFILCPAILSWGWTTSHLVCNLWHFGLFLCLKQDICLALSLVFMVP